MTGEELDEIGDDYDRLVRTTQEKTGKSQREVEILLDEIFTTLAMRWLWWARLGSNQEPTPYEGAALPLSYGPFEKNYTIRMQAARQ